MASRGPVIHYFHSFLENYVFRGRNQSSPRIVFSKLFIDQFLFAPLFTAVYFYFCALAEDSYISDTTKKIQRELWSIMRSNWAVWIPANFVSYYFVPFDLRVLFGSIIGLFWNAYLIAAVSAGPPVPQSAANSVRDEL